VDVTAPRIVVSADASIATSAAIVVDLGQLKMKSDASAIIASATKGAIQDGYFYDTFKMNVYGLTAIMVPDRSKPIDWKNSVLLGKLALVDTFDLLFTLQVANVATVEIPKIKLTGQLPLLGLQLSKEKLQETLTIVNAILNPPLNAVAEPEQPQGSRATYNRMKRISSGAAQMIKNQVLDTRNRDKLIGMVMGATAPIKKVAFIDPVDDESSEDASTSSSLSSSSSSVSQVQQRRMLAQVQFEIAQLSVSLSQVIGIENVPTALPVATIELRGLMVSVSATNQDVRLRLQLSALLIEDTLGERTGELKKIIEDSKSTSPSSPRSPGMLPSHIELGQIASLPPAKGPKQYLVKAGSVSTTGGDLISVSIDIVDRRVSQYPGADAKIDITIGTIEVELCRPTVAALLKTAADLGQLAESMQSEAEKAEAQIVATIQKQSQRSRTKSREAALNAAARAANKQKMDKQRELDTSTSNLPPPNSNAVLLTLKLGSVSLSLRKDGSNFFQVSVNDLLAKVVVDRSMVVHVTGRLGHVRGRDLQLTGPWSDILSIGEKPDSPNKTPALTFSLDYFDPKMPNWPGHEVVLSASVATLRFVVLMRLLSELEVYFSAFLKMYTLLGYVPNPEDTIVKLDISIANPLVIIPRSSADEEHVLVDLGKISVSNKLEYAAPHSDIPIVSKDNITVQITALNLKTFVNVGGQKLSEAKFVDNIDLALSVARNLIRVPEQPEIVVSASLPRFSLEIASERLLFFASLLGGNFSELPLRPDEDELRLVIEFLQSVNSSLLLPAESAPNAPPQAKQSLGKPPPPVARVDFQLQQISVTLLSGSGSTYDGISTSLIRFGMKNFGLKVATEADGSMELMVNLASVSLEDTRQASKNQYKTILGSYAAPVGTGGKSVSAPTDTPSKLGKASTENEISLQLVSLPANSLQVVTIEMTRPRIYIVPTQLESLFEFALPLIKQALRAQEVFATRSRFEAAAAQRRSTFLQEGNLKQKQETEYQRLVSEQQQEYRKAEARLQLLRASSTMIPWRAINFGPKLTRYQFRSDCHFGRGAEISGRSQ
jgi:hypothetical protein